MLYQMHIVSPLPPLQGYELPVVQLWLTVKPALIQEPAFPVEEKPMVKDSESLCPTEQDAALAQLMFS